MPVYQRQVIETPAVVEQDASVRRSWSTYSASQIVHGLVGLALVLLGAVAMARGGFSSPLGDPVVSVLGIAHTTIIGMIEVAAGVLLLIAALSPNLKRLGGFVGILLLVGGVLLLADTGLRNDLHTDSALGWVGVIAGALSLLAAFLPTTTRTSGRSVAVR